MSSIFPIPMHYLSMLVFSGFLIFVRINFFFVVSPFFNQMQIPRVIKILLSLFITGLLLCIVKIDKLDEHQFFSIFSMILVVQQMIVGMAMALILQMTFEMLRLCGHYIATSMQLNFAMSFSSSSGHQDNILGSMFFVFGLLIFMSLHGPLVLLKILISSFKYFPLSYSFLSITKIKSIALFADQMFKDSLLLALPVISTLMITNMALAVMTRLSPSMNIFSIGFPVTMLVGIATLIFSMPFILLHFNDVLHSSFIHLTYWLKS